MESEVKPKHSKAKAVLSIFGINLFLLPISITIGILVARILGPTDRGVYGFVLLFSGFIAPFFNFGAPSATNYFISTGIYKSSKVFWSALLIGLVSGLLTSIFIYWALSFNLFGNQPRQLSYSNLLLILGGIPLFTSYSVLARIIIASSQFKNYNQFLLVKGLLSPFLLLVFVVILGKGIDGAILSLFLSQLLIWLFLFISGYIKVKPKFGLNLNYIKNSLSFGMKAWLGGAATSVNSKLDHFLVGVFLPPAQLAYYGIAVSLSKLLSLLPNAMGVLFVNKMAEESKSGQSDKVLTKIHRSFIAFSYPFAIFFMVGGYFLIPLVYGASYAEASIPFIIYVPGITIYFTTQLIIKYLSGTGRPLKSSSIQLVMVIFSIPLFYYMSSLFGIVGASFANVLISIVGLGVALYFFKKTSDTSISNLYRVSSSDITWSLSMIKKSFK